MKTYPVEFLELNGEKIAYRSTVENNSSEKEVMILVHGNMSSSAHFNLLMDRLEPHYDVYAIDMRGFGYSTYNNRIDSLKDFSDELHAFTEALTLKTFDLLGWSTGGGVAMVHAAAYPESVNRLFLMESVGTTGYPMFKKDENMQPILTELLKTREEIEADPVQVAPVLKALETHDKGYYKDLWNLLIYNNGNHPDDDLYDYYLEDMLKQRNLVDIDYALVNFNISNDHNGVVDGSGEISNIKAKTFVLQGENELVVPMEMAKSIIEGLGEKAELHLLKGSGHNPMVDALDEVVEWIVGN